MAYINHIDLEAALLSPDINHIKTLLLKAKADVADNALIEAARDLHCLGTDDVEVDDFLVATSEGEGGIWVNAWLWVPTTEEEDS